MYIHAHVRTCTVCKSYATWTDTCTCTNVVQCLAGSDHQILVWDIGNAAQICVLRGHIDDVYQLAFSRDGIILASGERISVLYIIYIMHTSTCNCTQSNT